MSVTRQLYELQELDDSIEATRKTLDLKKHQLNNREALEKAFSILTANKKTLDELKTQRRNAETEAGDINAKIMDINKQLYGGKINNPKELGNLQTEVNQLTAHKDRIETATLDIIDKLEAAEKQAASLTTEYQKMDASWGAEQAQLGKDIELLTNTLAALQATRKEDTARIDQVSLALYERIRKMKKPAVTKVEQGICKGCRLSVSSTALQKARGGHAVQCGACGRILFVA